MKSGRFMMTILLVLIGLVMPVYSEQLLSDPYQILQKHFEATGGLGNLKAQRTMYKEGSILIEAAGLEGIFKQWSERPLRLRQETDLKVVTSVTGDNGEFSWYVDANEKLLIQRDEITLKERKVRKLMEEYEHLNPQSEYFTVTFEGVEKIEGRDCYVVKIVNKINQDIQLNYYDKVNFYLLRTKIIKPDSEGHISYADFRKVNGLILPFSETVRQLPTDQTFVITYSSYKLGIDIDGTLFEPPSEDVEDFAFENGVSAENNPVQFIENHIYVPVNIMGKERLWVLDCGASVNVIDSSFAAELGLAFEGPIKGQGASGVVDFYFATMPAYSVGSITFKEQKAAVFSFRHLFEKVLGLDVVGVLGYDFLSRFVTKIDYANQTISFYDPEKFEYTGKGEIFDSPLQGNMLGLQVTVDGKYSGKWNLDIGAPDLDFHFPYAKEHGLLDKDGFDVMAGDAAGFTTSRISKYKTVEVGGFVIKDPWIGTPREEGTGAFSAETVIGNIGNLFLRNFVLYLDYHDQRVILEKGEDFGAEFPRPKSGLQFHHNDDNDVEVVFVSPNTPADEAGFQKGDIINAVNGIDVQYFDGLIALRNLLKAKEGTTYMVEISRGGKILGKQLTLKNLL
ncbi:MAG: aspartyl protease family protein [candidate division WOR-3 bacterium]|nr:MAG: aspartyl protease family protein [candidate division WOR-3 bacterium]